MQVGGWHFSPMPLSAQTPLVQSLATRQSFPSPQRGQAGPPQSTSVSVPFFAPSLQLGVAHLPAVHTSLWQSLRTLQFLPSTHLPHAAPPQSTSLSVPFSVVSVQVGAWQAPSLQTLLVQSAAALHFFWVSHFLHLAPPQSMSLSSWFCAPSSHVASRHLPLATSHTLLAQSSGFVQSGLAASGALPSGVGVLPSGVGVLPSGVVPPSSVGGGSSVVAQPSPVRPENVNADARSSQTEARDDRCMESPGEQGGRPSPNTLF